MLEYTVYIKIFIGLLAIINPIGAVPIFVALTSGEQKAAIKRIENIVVITVTVILLVTLFFGELLLRFFGITISSFKVGGGILLLLMAISMLHARISETVHSKEELKDDNYRESTAVVPLSMPLLAGPGAISTVILYAQKGTNISHYFLMGFDILAVGIVLWVVLKSIPWISEHISQAGINIITRIMGLILAAIAIEFIANGIKGLFPVLAR